MKNDTRPRVGIVIQTMNRPDFLIRQLEYFVRMKNPHPIYIGDASNKKNKDKLRPVIEELGGRLNINYIEQPEGYPLFEARLDLYNKVKEEYCVYSGDDDYVIPDSLTKCAEFLQHNPDYSTASGYSIAFRLKENNVYGELVRLSEYPRCNIESSTASKRLIDIMSNFTILGFSVQRTKDRKKAWKYKIKDFTFCNDMFPVMIDAILGKAKLINCISLIRQLDNVKNTPFTNRHIFDWVVSDDFNSSYHVCREILANEISKIDKININEANKVVKQAFWSYFGIGLPHEYKKIYDDQPKRGKNGSLWRKIRFRLGQKIPWLKKFYLRIAPVLPIYEKVMQPLSPYYKDFKPVLDSFTGKYRNF